MHAFQRNKWQASIITAIQLQHDLTLSSWLDQRPRESLNYIDASTQATPLMIAAGVHHPDVCVTPNPTALALLLERGASVTYALSEASKKAGHKKNALAAMIDAKQWLCLEISIHHAMRHQGINEAWVNTLVEMDFPEVAQRMMDLGYQWDFSALAKKVDAKSRFAHWMRVVSKEATPDAKGWVEINLYDLPSPTSLRGSFREGIGQR